MEQKKRKGISFILWLPAIVQSSLVLLKLMDKIQWSWVWVLSPAIFMFSVFVLVCCDAVAIFMVNSYITEQNNTALKEVVNG